MKAILTGAFLFLATLPNNEKRLTITFNILPEVKTALKDRPIKLEVLCDKNSVPKRNQPRFSNHYNYTLDTTLINPQSIVFTNIKSDHVILRIGAWINCTDGISRKGLYSAMRVDIPKNETTVIITFPEDCEFNRYIGGKICPKCGKMDQSIPIIWGLPSFDLPGLPGVDYEPGSCFTSACDPDWYCKRDSLRF